MVILHIAAFLILLLFIAWKFRVQLVEAFPVGCSMWVLVLYVLSFFRALFFSDYFASIGLIAAIVYVARMTEERRKEFLDFSWQELSSASTITAFATVVIVTLCVKDKVVSWWDDYNFWATDVKSLFYLDGFAHKYANVAAEFGDYPPGTQMMKWWFLHFSPEGFKEGLLFAGYYFMNLSFLFPMLKVIKKRNILVMAAGGAVLWLFPTVAEAFWCDGCCADLTMAVVYGAFLVSVVDEKKDRLFYYGRQALFLMVMVLCKNTGFLWVAFGLLFNYGYHLLVRQRGRRQWRALAAVTLFPILVEGSWLGFCFVNRRVAKLTGAAFRMATGGMNIPAYQEEMVKAFVEAFFKWPLHRYKTITVDLSPFGLYVVLLVSVFLLYKLGIMDKIIARYTGIFLAVTGVLFYFINLLCHLTIFAVETQYLEPFGMISSIERYGAPFTLGGLYLIAYFVMKADLVRSKGGTAADRFGRADLRLGRSGLLSTGAAWCVVFVLLTCDYKGAYRALIGYRNTVESVMEERGQIVDEAAEEFLKVIGAGKKKSIGRVLYLRDISDVSWVRNTYIGFEAAPISVMYGNVDVTMMDRQGIIEAIRDAHAGFLYVDELVGDGKELFGTFLEGEEFAYGSLYQIVEDEGGVHFVKYARNFDAGFGLLFCSNMGECDI